MKNRKIVVTASISAVLALVLVLGWYVLFERYMQLQASFDNLQQKMAEGIDEQDAALEMVRVNQYVLHHNLNEGLRALNLPEAPEIADSGAEQEIYQKNGTGMENLYPEEMFYRGVQYFREFYDMQELSYRMEDLLESDVVFERFQNSGLSVRKSGRVSYRITGPSSDEALFGIEGIYNKKLPHIRVTPLIGEEKLIPLSDNQNNDIDALIDYVEKRQNDIKETGEEFQKRLQSFSRIMDGLLSETKQRQLNIDLITPKTVTAYSEYRVRIVGPPETTDTEGEILFHIGVGFPSCRFFIDNQDYDDEDDFKESLNSKIAEIDPRTRTEKHIDNLTGHLKELSMDPAFSSFLEEIGLDMSSEPRDSGDYIYFDLYESSGERYGAFAILKKVGKIYLTDREDIPVSSLLTAGSPPKIAPRQNSRDVTDQLPMASEFSQAGQAGETTLLLCGTHEKNADTIIIAKLTGGGAVRLLSVPRDIYFKNRKLNTHYRMYGIVRLKSILEQLMGVEFNGYISVDMYAFIDIVDILDGIDVQLDTALRDPTYRVRDNGEWTTLYYPAGLHHLSGVEALRIARSRHTSDDFDRSYRQQLIIQALWDRLSQIHAGKLKEVYDIFQVLSRYVDTDLNSYELAQYFLQYKDAEIQPRKSISTDNVLYTTYSNFYLSGLGPEDVEEDFNKGAWILLPKDDDWSLIPRFVHQQLSGGN